jgi:hypothetical protein
MCGSTVVNGYTFCSGLSKLELSYKTRTDLHSLIRSVTYLIRGAIFRPKYTTSPSSGLSLGELMDMYHTHEATMRHDKVYALLVMSSDGPGAAGLSPDYTVSWKDLLQRLIEFIIFKEVLVETWDEREIAVIKGKGCILGQVSSVDSDGARYDRQDLKIAFNDTPKSLEYEKEYGTRWSLRASAKRIREDDFVYLLQGSSKPAIVRRCKDHFAIIMIAVTPLQSEPTERGYIDRQEPLASTKSFSCGFLLVWNWENSPEDLQDRAGAGYETLPEINSRVPEYLKTALDKAARSYEVALVFGDSEDPKEAEKRQKEGIKACEELFGKEDPRTLEGMENLAWLYEKPTWVNKGHQEWAKAEDLLLRVIETRKRVQGIDHQDTLNSIADLAWVYIDHSSFFDGQRRLARTLTGRIRDNVQITEEEMEKVAQDVDKELITLLLQLKKVNIPVTENVVKAAARAINSDAMRLLLDRRGKEVKITEEVVKAAAGNQWSERIMALILEQRGTEVKITEEVVKAAAGNCYRGNEIMALLLDQGGTEVKITGEVVKAAAGNQYVGKEIMALLLDQRGTEVKITEEVVKAAAGNWNVGKEIMALLLDQRGTEVKITEKVVKAAAGNWNVGKEIMALLLDQRSTEVKITGEIVKEVAGNATQGKEIMALLRKHKGDEVKIAEQELKEAASTEPTSYEVV